MAEIIKRKDIAVSQWVKIIEKTVRFNPGEEPEIYHCLTQSAYVSMFAQLEDGRIPIVRQYRPAVEAYTWEFPAGTVDRGENPRAAAERELLEETGLVATETVDLGTFYPDTGRLQVESHGFFMRAKATQGQVESHEAIETRYISHSELRQMMRTGEFRHQLHLALYAAALVRDVELLP